MKVTDAGENITCSKCLEVKYQNSPGDHILCQFCKVGLNPSQSRACRYLLRSLRDAKRRAQKRALCFSIDRQWCVDTLIHQSFKCAITGKSFSTQKTGTRVRLYAPSIDRVLQSKGYTPDNCVVVLSAINNMKNDMRMCDFLDLCDLVMTHRAVENETIFSAMINDGQAEVIEAKS